MKLSIDLARLGVENVLFAELNKSNLLHLFGERFASFLPSEELAKQLTQKPNGVDLEGYFYSMQVQFDKEQSNSVRLDGMISSTESLAEEGFKHIRGMYCFITELQHNNMFSIDFYTYVSRD